MLVVATAGHVDHGKSALVRALTGMEPDRWAEERRRGMTLDLGYSWCQLPSGRDVAFVDVPGHERLLGNMIAGLSGASAVLFVVAADGGWAAQSEEHLAVASALDIQRGVLAVTRCDLADPAPALADARRRIARTSLGDVVAVAVASPTGRGLDELLDALNAIADTLAPADPAQPVRLWVDRAFSMHGVGTVVTGTLPAGTLRVDDGVSLGTRDVRIRGLQTLGVERSVVSGPARVAVNLRGVARGEVARGDALVTTGSHPATGVIDVRAEGADALSREMQLHVGTARTACRTRPLGESAARLQLATELPLRVGDRVVLRDSGSRRLVPAVVLDTRPPPLRRRGSARARAEELAAVAAVPDVAGEVERRGALRHVDIAALGLLGDPPPDAVTAAGWLVSRRTWDRWCQSLRDATLERGELRLDTALGILGCDDVELVHVVADAVGVRATAGALVPSPEDAAERALREVERRLAADCFDAPSLTELAELGLTGATIDAAVAARRLLRVGDGVLLSPSAPLRALDILRQLDEWFTTSAARAALGTPRRVAVPLLEYMDQQEMTARDGSLRRLRS